MKSSNFSYSPLSRIFIVTQSANEHLCNKYSDSFNFFQAKSINQIVFNHKSERVTLAAKDIAVLVEDTEFLKRSKTIDQKPIASASEYLNCQLDFYANADLLKYEYPMMILTQTNEIFLKRQKRFKQIGNDRGSSDSSNSVGQRQYVPNDESFLQDLQWNQLIVDDVQDVGKKIHRQTAKQFQQDDYCIYGNNDDKKSDSKIRYLANQISVELIFNSEQDENEVSYLVLDFDDLDREEVMRQYKKISNKENIAHPSDYISALEQKGRFPNKIKSLMDKKALNSTIHVSFIDQIKLVQSRQQLCNANLLGSREERERQFRLMRKSIQQLDGRTKSSNRQQMFTQERGKMSVLSQFMTQTKHTNPSQFKIEEKKNEKFNYNLQKNEKITNLYGKPLMKQSQMLSSNYQLNSNLKSTKQVNINCQKLNYLKQTTPQVLIRSQGKKDKQRFRLPLGLIKKQKQDKFNLDEAGILKIKEPDARLSHAKSGGYLRYSTQRVWTQQREWYNK